MTFALAPMAELSHRALRELVASFGGCDEYYSEMISAAGLLGGGPFERYYLDSLPEPGRLVYQIAGSDEGRLVRAASLLDGRECLGVDINMGCSAPAIVRSGAGAAWLRSVDGAARLVAAVRRVVKRRLSVKLRLGWEDDFGSLVKFCRALAESGADLIVLHPRTAREKFHRQARWDRVAALARELPIPVGGNGDISGPASLAERAKGPWAAVMAGRAAVRTPWLFAHAKALLEGSICPPPVSLEETGLRFLDLLAKHQPAEFHLSRARRFFALFTENLTWGAYLNNLLNRRDSLSEIAGAWSAWFREHPEDACSL
jgi:tRNA-dihydrouridine synthase